MKTNDIRSLFLSYFKQLGHKVTDSSPLVPQNDPTLLFTNAGMVQFKDYFVGADVPKNTRATTSQKCVRAGGKHNDLDNVGYTARHHTFFEMLGNFSFGDYFKEEAISYAWGLINKELGLDPSRLLVTVFHNDDEAATLWKKIAGFSDDRIIRIATNDNFWAMGDTGPCGPCTEIFYDHGEHIPGGPPGSPNEDGDRFIEIWNLVFMQFEQLKQTDGSIKKVPLPKPSIDTGIGLERLAALLQGKHNNYEIDIFADIIKTSQNITGNSAPDLLSSHRVIADHLRSSGFLISDGVLPSNDGRGYVLRRIMRRAMRHVHKLGYSDLLMHQMVPVLIQTMGEAYPDLVRAQPVITEMMRLEEERFRATLDRGMSLLQDASSKVLAGGILPGDVAFKLYDTYGFPLDLTQDIMRGEEKSVDTGVFDQEMKKQKEMARAKWSGSGELAVDPIWFEVEQSAGATDFLGYSLIESEAKICAIVKSSQSLVSIHEGDEAVIISNQTPFYAESGGQAGDVGIILQENGSEFVVSDTQKRGNGLFAHFGQVKKGGFSVSDLVRMKVNDENRLQLRSHHSATHLLHKALQITLGGHVMQKGSLVTAERLRFDFSQPRAVTKEQLREVEDLVNFYVRQNSKVETSITTPGAAKEAGATALFGEKYGEAVRVVSMGFDKVQQKIYSTELCGGTHVNATGDIGLFKITSESSVASGVRRIEAVAGKRAEEYVYNRDLILEDLNTKLKCATHQLVEKFEGVSSKIKQLEKNLKLKVANTSAGDNVETFDLKGGGRVGIKVLEDVLASELRSASDALLRSVSSGVAVVFAKTDKKVSIVVTVSKDKLGAFDAVIIARRLSEILGGKGGGGRPDFAQAGGTNSSKISEAIVLLKSDLIK